MAAAACIFLLLIGCMGGYRLDGLSAAKANSFVPKDSVLLDKVNYRWGSIYIFDSPEKPVTAVSRKTLGFLWSSKLTTWHYHRDDPIRTIGGTTIGTPGETATVIGIVADDPAIVYVEAGVDGNRIRAEVQAGEPLSLAWDDPVQLDKLKPQAFSHEGELLYEYRYPVSNYTRQEELKWYPIQ